MKHEGSLPAVHATINRLESHTTESESGRRLRERLFELQQTAQKITHEIEQNALEPDDFTDIVDEIASSKQEGGLTLEELYRDIILTIQQQTNLFHGIAEVGMFADLVNHEFEKKKIGGKHVTWQDTNKNRTQNSSYNNIKDKIIIVGGDKPPGRAEILGALAYFGQLPGRMSTLHHELVHGAQSNNSLHKKNHWLNPANFAAFATDLSESTNQNRHAQWSHLAEAQAYNSEIGMLADAKFADAIVESYKYDKEIFVRAFEIIEILDGLGYDTHEVITVLRNSMKELLKVPKQEPMQFKAVKTAIDTKLQTLKLTEQDIPVLMQIHTIEKVVAQMRAMLITHKKIKETALKLGVHLPASVAAAIEQPHT